MFSLGLDDNPPIKKSLVEPKQISLLKAPKAKTAYVAMQQLQKSALKNSKLSLLCDPSPSNTGLLQPPLQSVKGQGLYMLENQLLQSITGPNPYTPKSVNTPYGS